jgi:hypothetical protein
MSTNPPSTSPLTIKNILFLLLRTIFLALASAGVFFSLNEANAIWAIQSSYFDKNILQEGDTFNETINNIHIWNYSFSSSVEQKRYLNSKRFFQSVKTEIREKFGKNEISTYKAQDIINELTYISFYLDEYFKHMKSFEKTKNIAYKNIAKSSLQWAEQSYRNLTNITRSIY